MTAKEKIEDYGYENVIIFDNPSYDNALIGVTYNTNQAVYDYEMMVEYLVNNEEMTYDEAADFISYNSSYYYGNGYPIIICKFVEEENSNGSNHG